MRLDTVRTLNRDGIAAPPIAAPTPSAPRKTHRLRWGRRTALCVGDLVQIRDREEILATLDENGKLDGLPFMPQMLQYCGQQFRVAKRAHKLCDTVNATGARRMKDAVLLDGLHCNGQAYGGCEMDCQIFWKEAWLRPVSPGADSADEPASGRPARCTEADIWRNVMPPEKQQPGGPPVYSCQATEMPYATTPLSVWSPGQYVEDVRSGNASVKEVVSVLAFLVFNTLATSGLGFGSFLRWSYDSVQRRRRRSPYPCRRGRIPRGAKTPSANLGLQPGDVVKVKSLDAVLDTVTEDLVNRGMGFHPEMVPYCDRSFRVARRLRRLMNEKTGTILELKNECLVLEGAQCVGKFSKPLLCPRGMSPYWREVWLEPAEGKPGGPDGRKNGE